jgi:hypothetical protein
MRRDVSKRQKLRENGKVYIPLLASISEPVTLTASFLTGLLSLFLVPVPYEL